MKHLTIILSILLLVMLQSCYTKKAAVRKFCTPSTFDTVVAVSDTLVIDSSYTDTVFSSKVDSIYIRDGKLSIKYIRIHDSVYLSGKYDVDTFIRTDTVRISIPQTVYNCKQTFWEWAGDNWKWILLAMVFGFLISRFSR